MSRNQRRFAALAGAFVVAVVSTSCGDGAAPTNAAGAAPQTFTGGRMLTPSSGSQSTLLGRATFGDPSRHTFKVKRISGDWHVEVKATPNLDMAVQRIVFQPGGQSGWHQHPGPVFIQVVVGTMTFYESDDPRCTPIVRTAGQGYLDVGEHAHIARNESGAAAENIVVYLAPQAAPLRIDAAAPGNCPF